MVVRSAKYRKVRHDGYMKNIFFAFLITLLKPWYVFAHSNHDHGEIIDSFNIELLKEQILPFVVLIIVIAAVLIVSKKKS
jgi:hypothetical protein